MRHCIFRYVSGSRQYGTNRPDSDFDYRAVFIAPLSSAFELFQSNFVGSGSLADRLKLSLGNIEAGDYQAAVENIKAAMGPDVGDLNFAAATIHHPFRDEEAHELRRFLKLVAQNNPNTLEALYVERLIEHETDIWKRIRAKRDLFLSKKVRWTFSGYAAAQMKRIETHRGYLLNPPGRMPTRGEFGLPNETRIAKENQNAILSLPDQWVNDEAKDYVKREKAFSKALLAWQSYQKWDKERNPLRKEMERKWGVDCKHAMHLCRLVRMAKEILKDGTVLVQRPDAEELKAIINGALKYEDLLKMVGNMDSELDALYVKSPLRHTPDFKGISELYKGICEEYYGIRIGG